MWYLRTFGGSIFGVGLLYVAYLLNLWLDFIPKYEPYDYQVYDDYSSVDDAAYHTDAYDPYASDYENASDYSYEDAKMAESEFAVPYDEEMAPDAPGLDATTVRERLASLDADVVQDSTGSIWKITIRGLIFNSHLETLSQVGTLEELSCEQPQYIDDDGLRHLAGLTRLRQLSLPNASITDAGLVHLEGLSNLAVLDLTGSSVTFEGISRLQETLPFCDIRY